MCEHCDNEALQVITFSSEFIAKHQLFHSLDFVRLLRRHRTALMLQNTPALVTHSPISRHCVDW